MAIVVGDTPDVAEGRVIGVPGLAGWALPVFVHHSPFVAGGTVPPAITIHVQPARAGHAFSPGEQASEPVP